MIVKWMRTLRAPPGNGHVPEAVAEVDELAALARSANLGLTFPDLVLGQDVVASRAGHHLDPSSDDVNASTRWVAYQSSEIRDQDDVSEDADYPISADGQSVRGS